MKEKKKISIRSSRLRKKAIEFQEMYYPCDGEKYDQEAIRQAIRFAFAQGVKMGCMNPECI